MPDMSMDSSLTTFRKLPENENTPVPKNRGVIVID